MDTHFFLFNEENRIGFKKLSAADLGLSSTSHQSHIGLYEGVLEFLDDSDVVQSAMLIYEDYCEVLNCSFDRIENPDGTFRSPKIKIGSDSNNSLVAKIRNFVKEYPYNDWYLAWMGLESKELVFWLIKSNTQYYEVAREFFPQSNFILEKSSSTFNEAKKYLLNRINFLSAEIQKDIEVCSIIGDLKNKYRRIDLDNAERRYKQIGMEGESLVAQYLEKEKMAGRILSFEWKNKSSESGLPFDFIVNNTMYMDVKSTVYDFEQFLFYSSQEIDFAISQKESTYSVFRVYDMGQEQKKLAICNNCQIYMKSIQKPLAEFQNNIATQQALVQSVKLGVKPSLCFNDISKPIIL